MTATLNRTALQPGDRVHHRGVLWSRWLGEGQGWGTVMEAKPQHDGSTEYLVQPDEPLLPGGGNEPRWWASYHLDEWSRA